MIEKKGYQPLNEGYQPRREERGYTPTNSGGQDVVGPLPAGGSAQSQGGSGTTQGNGQTESKK